MIALAIRVLFLVVRAHAVWPAQPIERVAIAAIAAARAERDVGVAAELLLAIAEHESDLKPNAVSWRDDMGRRRDALVDNLCTGVPVDRAAAVGLVQTIARSRAACRSLIRPRAAMLAGARELAEWIAACGDWRLAFAGYANGWDGVRAARDGRATIATAFADLFLARARALGWTPTRRTP